MFFADDTTIYGNCSDISQLITLIQSQLKPFLEWVKFNKLTINWGKTKLMFLTNKRIKKFLLPWKLIRTWLKLFKT